MCSASREVKRAAPAAEAAAAVARVPVTRLRGGERSQDRDAVVREVSLLLLVGGRTVCRLQCSPGGAEDLALGFLCTAGLLPPDGRTPPMATDTDGQETRADVGLDTADAELERFRDGLVAGTGCGRGVFSVKGFDPLDCGRKMDVTFRVSAETLAEAMRKFQKVSDIYRETGGVHSAGVADPDGRLVAFAEDVGRHNAVDKVIGSCLRHGVPLSDKSILTTGRLSLDLAAKAVRAGVPVAASRSAPTDAGVELARLANLTLIGFLRGDRMNLYAAEWRIE